MKDPAFTAIGVDVGGTKIAVGAVTFPGGELRARRVIPTRPQAGGASVLAEVERLVSAVAAEVRADGTAVQAIGVGVCELVDRDGEIVSSHCLDWTRSAVCERLSTLAPTVIEADVRAGALAEAWFGAGRDSDVFLYVSIGTGIASCLVLGGQPFVGSRGATGTMGSGLFPQLEAVPANNQRRSLEQLAAGPALVSRYQSLHGRAVTVQEVLAAATAGDRRALDVILPAAEALGGSLGWLVNVLDPNLVILGGGLGSEAGIFHDQLVAAARRHVWWPGHRDVPIVSAHTGPEAGLIGAATFAWLRFQATPPPRKS